MRYLTWEDSVSALKHANTTNAVVPLSLVFLERNMRWKNVNIGNFRIIPIRFPMKVQIGQETFSCPSPYSNLLIIECSTDSVAHESIRSSFEPTVGLSFSTIFSFVMRCSVIGYADYFPPAHNQNGSIQISGPGSSWAERWQQIFEWDVGLNSRIFYNYPTLEEEQHLVGTLIKVYDKLMELDEKRYLSVIGSMRLYQLAFYVAREDLSLAYSLLVAAIDAISSGTKSKLELSDIDAEGKLQKVMGEIKLSENTQKAVVNLIVHDASLTKRFCNFIIQNSPNPFWNNANRLGEELVQFTNEYQTEQNFRELSEYAPPELKSRLLQIADERQKHYEEHKKQKNVYEDVAIKLLFSDERRELVLKYVQTHFEKVLSNTFGNRSAVLHRGKAFPKHALKRDNYDWVPAIYEEDFPPFFSEHLRHSWSYDMSQEGKIIRQCSCGEKKEVKVIFSIRVFEKIVHDSILNYVLSL